MDLDATARSGRGSCSGHAVGDGGSLACGGGLQRVEPLPPILSCAGRAPTGHHTGKRGLSFHGTPLRGGVAVEVLLVGGTTAGLSRVRRRGCGRAAAGGYVADGYGSCRVTALEERERLVMGARAGCSRRHAPSLRGAGDCFCFRWQPLPLLLRGDQRRRQPSNRPSGASSRYGHRYESEAELVPENPNSEWPPSPYTMSAFSSETWRWEERSFIREGMAPRSIDPKLLPLMTEVLSRDAVYWRGRLYVYNIFFIIRLELEDNKYRVIQFPPINEARGSIMPHLGKSEKGVYYGFVHHDWCKLQIWFLNESTDHTEWMLKHEIDLKPLLEKFPWKHGDGSWFVQGVKDNKDETLDKEKPEWDSDDDDATIATTTEVSVHERFPHYSSNILGFHPYKEIIFLHMSYTRVVAYHLSSSKVEDLGCLPLEDDDWIASSVVYTPCWMESCLRANSLEVKY